MSESLGGIPLRSDPMVPKGKVEFHDEHGIVRRFDLDEVERGQETERETTTTTHPPDQAERDEALLEAYDQPPRDCQACHTKRTRACEDCGRGRVHNEMHDGILVEMCFSCGDRWRPRR